MNHENFDAKYPRGIRSSSYRMWELLSRQEDYIASDIALTFEQPYVNKKVPWQVNMVLNAIDNENERNNIRERLMQKIK